jgi:hypothetical protein
MGDCIIWLPTVAMMRQSRRAMTVRSTINMWYLHRILLPYSTNMRPALALAKLQAVISFHYGDQSNYQNEPHAYGPDE